MQAKYQTDPAYKNDKARQPGRRRVPIWRKRERYRKQLKRGYYNILYFQRNKDESIISVIKRPFGEHIRSRLIRMQKSYLSDA
jgi:hypothetical protein